MTYLYLYRTLYTRTLYIKSKSPTESKIKDANNEDNSSFQNYRIISETLTHICSYNSKALKGIMCKTAMVHYLGIRTIKVAWADSLCYLFSLSYTFIREALSHREMFNTVSHTAFSCCVSFIPNLCMVP